MYKIITNTGETHLTEKPTFIRKHENGCFVLTDEEMAEGVAYNGTPYLFKDGAMVCEVDKGADILETEKTVSDNDAMNVDQEYRLTLLELGLTE